MSTLLRIHPVHLRTHDNFGDRLITGVSHFPSECGQRSIPCTSTTNNLEYCSCFPCLEVYFGRLEGMTATEYRQQQQERAHLRQLQQDHYKEPEQ